MWNHRQLPFDFKLIFCFARGTNREIFATDFSKDKVLLISQKWRFHPKHFSKADLKYEHPKMLLGEELLHYTECIWCSAGSAPVVIPFQVWHRGPGEDRQSGSTGSRACTPWPCSQVHSDDVLVCSNPKTIITQLAISPLLASGASCSAGSHYAVAVVLEVILCSSSEANASGDAFLMDNSTESLIFPSVNHFPVASFSDELQKKVCVLQNPLTAWSHLPCTKSLGLRTGRNRAAAGLVVLSLCLTYLVQRGVSVFRMHLQLAVEYFILWLADDRQCCCW